MRLSITTALGVTAVLSLTAPAWAEFNKVPNELYEAGRAASLKPQNEGRYLEVIQEAEFEAYSSYIVDYFEKLTAHPPLLAPDLPNPYNSSVRNQSGYYSSTGTEPVLDREVIR